MLFAMDRWGQSGNDEGAARNMMVDHGDDDDLEVKAMDRIGHAVVHATGFLLCAPRFSRAAICAGRHLFTPRHARHVMGQSALPFQSHRCDFWTRVLGPYFHVRQQSRPQGSPIHRVPAAAQ
jgi:hypothetical protein